MLESMACANLPILKIHMQDHWQDQKFWGSEAVVTAVVESTLWWDRLTAEELRRKALNFRMRLTLCIEAEGGHFEPN